MPDKHLSSQYDAELGQLSGKLLEMGGWSKRNWRARSICWGNTNHAW